MRTIRTIAALSALIPALAASPARSAEGGAPPPAPVAEVPAAAADVATPAKTPPTVLDAWNLEGDFAKLRQQWPEIEAALKDEDYFKLRVEKTSRWGCGLHAGHMVMVLKLIADGIEEIQANPEKNSDGKHFPIAKMIFNRGVMPRGVGKAPGEVMPLGGSREQWLKDLAETRARWERFEADKEKLRTLPGRVRHFAFGDLTASDWVRFAGIHTAHHLKIVRDILLAAGEEGKAFGAGLR